MDDAKGETTDLARSAGPAGPVDVIVALTLARIAASRVRSAMLWSALVALAVAMPAVAPLAGQPIALAVAGAGTAVGSAFSRRLAKRALRQANPRALNALDVPVRAPGRFRRTVRAIASPVGVIALSTLLPTFSVLLPAALIARALTSDTVMRGLMEAVRPGSMTGPGAAPDAPKGAGRRGADEGRRPSRERSRARGDLDDLRREKTSEARGAAPRAGRSAERQESR